MNTWMTPVPHRWEHTSPISPIQRYAGSSSYPDPSYPEAGRYNAYTPGNGRSRQQTSSEADPEMVHFARHVALLIQAAQEVADQAAALRGTGSLSGEDFLSFMEHADRMIEQDAKITRFLDTTDISEDGAYLPTYRETVEYWEQQALSILAAPPLDLITDEVPLHSYAAYNEDKQKTWRLPRQGWLMQTYG